MNLLCNGPPDPVTGLCGCECAFQDVVEITVPFLGTVCINPISAESCPVGVIDCDGGADTDVDLEQWHNVGACIDQSNCQASCDAWCTGQGKLAWSAVCEDATFGVHPNVCNCECLGIGDGVPDGPGNASVYCGFGIDVEAEAPCSGDDVLFSVAPFCYAFTTTTASGEVIDANNTPGASIGPFQLEGEPFSCPLLFDGFTTGAQLVTTASYFDNEILGDIEALITITCQ